MAVSAFFAAPVAWLRRRAETVRHLAYVYAVESDRNQVLSARSTGDKHYRLWCYYSDLESKYSDAAQHPWLPIASDPPPPK
jgi:hypothetical protein